MSLELRQKVLLYQITTMMGVAFGLIAFSYNVWRMEITEANNNTRMACFEILTELSELEQLVYAAYYDNNLETGSPRIGWVKVGLINDLSFLVSPMVETSSASLKYVWSKNADKYSADRKSVDRIVAAIDGVRTKIKSTLNSLK